MTEELNLGVEAEAIDREAEITTGIEKKKRRRREDYTEDRPVELSKLSGEDTIKILDFLHRRYLSWMTEAESTKYTSVYKTAKDEAIKEALETYAEIQKQNQQLLERMEKLIQALEGKLTTTPPAQEIAQQTAEQIKKSLLDDPRVRGLIFVGLESLFGNNPQYQKLRDFLVAILFPEATAKESEKHE